MRKFILMILAGAALMLAAPQFSSAAPVGLGTSLATAADRVSNVDIVRFRHWRGDHWRHHRRWERRHWRMERRHWRMERRHWRMERRHHRRWWRRHRHGW